MVNPDGTAGNTMDNSAICSHSLVFVTKDDVDDHSAASDDVEGGQSGYEDEDEKVVIATSETRQVLRLRATLMLVLVAVAGFVCFVVYITNSENEQNEFESYATEACKKVTSSFEYGATRRLTAIASLAKSISSNAAAQGLSWPNVVVPDFEERMSLTLDLAQVMSIILLPLVTGESLEEWSKFSIENQGWFQEGLDYQASRGTNFSLWKSDIELMEAAMGDSPNNTIPEGIYQLGSNTSANPEDGPFMPWWMFSPIFPIHNLVNYDTLSNPSRRYQLKAVLKSKEALVSEAWDYSDTENPATFGKKTVLNLFLRQWEEGGKSYQDGPVSDLYYPIFDNHNNHTYVAAVLTAYVYWQVYFEKVLHADTEPVVAVLGNTCGSQDELSDHGMEANHYGHEHDCQSRAKDGTIPQRQQQFSYIIRGETATYLGPGDLHDPKFDYLEESTGWRAFLAKTTTEDELLEGQCIYRVRVYPTQAMHDALSTKQPLYFMLIVLATFVVTSVIFVVYDYYVEHRQEVVLNKAIKSTEVVNTMFPEKVRNRLFEDSSGNLSSPRRTGRLLPRQEETSTTDNNASMDVFDMNDSGKARGSVVADLYENCSVLFADIAGFTRWSSGREPSDIFQLLEALYGAFDRIARRRGVFKVETIGDCYLAITGVPSPQKDHAVIMTKFAMDCLEKMDYLIHAKLLQQLGEDTSQLKLRCGIHSGPVTAGVLRGERARFQLFGDTVNTASRMESLSLPGRIQVSAETAKLLVDDMKEDWLCEREGGVDAKGKGNLATFWAIPAKRPSRARLAASVSTDGLSGDSELS